jgi:DNA-binding CsgD family transcriptional regulator
MARSLDAGRKYLGISVNELCARAGVNPADYRAIMSRFGGRHPQYSLILEKFRAALLSLQYELSEIAFDSGGDSKTEEMAYFLISEYAKENSCGDFFIDHFDREERLFCIYELSSCKLSPREAGILKQYVRNEKTFSEIGVIYNLSAARVSQLYNQAIQKLRNSVETREKEIERRKVSLMARAPLSNAMLQLNISQDQIARKPKREKKRQKQSIQKLRKRPLPGGRGGLDVGEHCHAPDGDECHQCTDHDHTAVADLVVQRPGRRVEENADAGSQDVACLPEQQDLLEVPQGDSFPSVKRSFSWNFRKFFISLLFVAPPFMMLFALFLHSFNREVDAMFVFSIGFGLFCLVAFLR